MRRAPALRPPLLLPLVLLSLLFGAACASDPDLHAPRRVGLAAGGERPASAGTNAGTSAGTSVEVSVEASVERLAADVAWLADDARDGRRAGTPGERAAVEWIAARLEALGLEPAGEDGGWLQPVEVPLPVRRGEGSAVASGASGPEAREASLARDGVVPLAFAAAGEVTGPLRFAGYGVRPADLGAGDGAVALVVRGEPPFPPSDPDAEDGRAAGESPGWAGAGSLLRKALAAKHAGYAALVVAEHPARAGALPAFDASTSARAGIPAVAVDAAVAERLFGAGDGRWAALVALADGDDAALPVEVGRHARVVADVVRDRGTAHNVLGLVRGRDPARTVVVGAHLDHLGRGGPGSLAPDAAGEVHNGADDNASGTAAALEIARLLAEGPPPEGDVLVALWSGEELGLLGSRRWIRAPTVPLERVRANVNLDMVGRAGDGVLQVLGAGSSPALAPWLAEAGPAAGLDLRVSLSGRGLGGSDHHVFLEREIPALHLFSGVHTDYHRPSDDPERVEPEGIARVVALAVDLVRRLQAADEVAWSVPDEPETAPPTTAWRVWFGTVPDYADADPGLLLAGTSPGSPAEAAGLVAGDRLLSVGDVEIGTIHDFMYVLSIHKPGDVVRTTFVRGGEEDEVLVTLAPRGSDPH